MTTKTNDLIRERAVGTERRGEHDGEPVTLVELGRLGDDSTAVKRWFEGLRHVPPHPSLILPAAVREEDGVTSIVEAECEGELLSTILERGPLDYTEALQILLDLINGLTHLHHHRLLHGGISARSVLVAEEDGAKRGRLLDVGLAAAIGPKQVTPFGSVRVDVAFAAPEALKAEPIDPRADVYSLGVLLHWMLAGKHPIHAPANAVLRLLKEAPSLLPSGIVDDTRPFLEDAIRASLGRALHKDPSRRFGSTRAFGLALRPGSDAGSMDDPWAWPDPAPEGGLCAGSAQVIPPSSERYWDLRHSDRPFQCVVCDKAFSGASHWDPRTLTCRSCAGRAPATVETPAPEDLELVLETSETDGQVRRATERTRAATMVHKKVEDPEAKKAASARHTRRAALRELLARESATNWLKVPGASTGPRPAATPDGGEPDAEAAAVEPAKADAKPAKADAKPAKADAKPAKADAKPAKAATVEAKAKPAKAATVEAKAKPAADAEAQAESKAAKTGAKSATADASPPKAKATPAKAEEPTKAEAAKPKSQPDAPKAASETNGEPASDEAVEQAMRDAWTEARQRLRDADDKRKQDTQRGERPKAGTAGKPRDESVPTSEPVTLARPSYQVPPRATKPAGSSNWVVAVVLLTIVIIIGAMRWSDDHAQLLTQRAAAISLDKQLKQAQQEIELAREAGANTSEEGKARLETAVAERERLAERLKDVTTSHDALRAKGTALAEEKVTLETDLAAVKVARDRLGRELVTARETIAAHERAANTAAAEIKRLQEESKGEKAQRKALGARIVALESAETELAQAKKKLAALELADEQATRKIAQLEKQVHVTELALVGARKQLETAAEELRKAKAREAAIRAQGKRVSQFLALERRTLAADGSSVVAGAPSVAAVGSRALLVVDPAQSKPLLEAARDGSALLAVHLEFSAPVALSLSLVGHSVQLASGPGASGVPLTQAPAGKDAKVRFWITPAQAKQLLNGSGDRLGFVVGGAGEGADVSVTGASLVATPLDEDLRLRLKRP